VEIILWVVLIVTTIVATHYLTGWLANLFLFGKRVGKGKYKRYHYVIRTRKKPRNGCYVTAVVYKSKWSHVNYFSFSFDWAPTTAEFEEYLEGKLEEFRKKRLQYHEAKEYYQK